MKIIRSILYFVAIGFISHSSICIANNLPVKSISFRILDADKDMEINANIYIDEEKIDKKYFLPEGAQSRISVEVKVDAGKSYKSRQFVVYLEGMKKQSVPFHIYMAEHGDQNNTYNIASIDPIRDWILYGGQSPDRAVVMLERIRDSKFAKAIPKKSSFHVYLDYVLAKAYIKNCTIRFVDQCDSAKNINAHLSDNFDEYQTIMKSMQITKESLNFDSNHFYLPLRYNEAKWEFACGRFEKSIELYDEIILKLENNPQYLSSIQVSLANIRHAKSVAEMQLKKNENQI